MPGKAKSKSAGKNAIKAGPSGGMAGFKPVGEQAPDTTAVKGSGGGKSFAAKIKAGPSGKMQGFVGVKPVKKA
jgi:hypothetical protein